MTDTTPNRKYDSSLYRMLADCVELRHCGSVSNSQRLSSRSLLSDACSLIVCFMSVDFCHVVEHGVFYVFIFVASDQLQTNGCKLSVLLTFYISTMPTWRPGTFVCMEASIDYAAFRI